MRLILLINMGRKEYTSLSIPNERHVILTKKFKKIINSDLSFTEWYVRVAENMVERYRLLKKEYPNLSLIKSSKRTFILNDSKKPDLAIKVALVGNNMICSDKSKNQTKYIQYTLLHPEFDIS